MDCLLRHLLKWWYFGEECDAETGEHHLDYVLCNLVMLRHYVRAYPEGDDRPPRDLTGFGTAWEDFIKCFDEEDFLQRNPAIRELLAERAKRTKKRKGKK